MFYDKNIYTYLLLLYICHNATIKVRICLVACVCLINMKIYKCALHQSKLSRDTRQQLDTQICLLFFSSSRHCETRKANFCIPISVRIDQFARKEKFKKKWTFLLMVEAVWRKCGVENRKYAMRWCVWHFSYRCKCFCRWKWCMTDSLLFIHLRLIKFK